MENIDRFNRLNKYLKSKFGERTLKICIDGGFTCPNRDGTKGFAGCIFCSEKGSGEHIKSAESISLQVRNYFESYKAERANKFIAYFQNFSNTHASVDVLKEKYYSALNASKKIVGIAIATRPDCISNNIVSLLKEISKKYYVLVELGLQTSNEQTAKLINRGYLNSDFVSAVNLLNSCKIDVVAHVMVGLPAETQNDVLNTIKFLNNLPITGIKIHSTYIIKNTKLEKMFLNGSYQPITQEFYVNTVAQIIKMLRKDIVICRISGDPPKDILVAPTWQTHKKLVINAINKKLNDDNIFQGDEI